MIPISDEDRPGRGIAIITLGLIIVNVLAFLFELTLSTQALDAFIQNYGTVPKEILTGVDVPPPGPTPLFLTLITSMFLHGGWEHILGNMLYLWIFGDDIEEAFGPVLYLIFYFVVGILAGLTYAFTSGAASTDPAIGASGAIAGVLGAYLVLYPGRQVHVLIPGVAFGTTRVSALVVLAFWFVLQFFTGIAALSDRAAAGGVAVWAHIGGFIAGAIIAFLLHGRAERATQAQG